MLSQFLTSQLFAFLLIFCRLGSALMLLPGFGEVYVAVRARLLMALFFSLTLVPVVGPSLPHAPESVAGLVTLMSEEIIVGLFIGGLSRIFIAALHMAGTIIAYQASLSSSLTNDIAQFSGQDTTVANLLSFTAVALIFVTNLHHLMLKSLMDSYTLFLPGHIPPIGDMAEHASRSMNAAFRMAMQLAAPHIAVGLVVYLAAGIIARLMPTIQIFFIMMAPQLLLSFFIFMAIFSTMMMWYLDYFKDSFSVFLAP